ncbi:MAG: InlB B-repeat-containing protein [Bacilli bacterium]
MKRKGFLIIALLIAFGILFAGCTPEATPSLSLSSSSFTTVVGETATIVPTIGGVEGLTLTYASDDDTIASVADGVITAKAAGTAKITVSLTDYPEIKVEATVVVKAKAPITLNFSSTSVTTVAGRTLSVVPAIGGTSEALVLEYVSSNTAVATVADGVVTAVAAGQAKITVSVEDQPTIKAEVNVTVLPVVTLDDFAPTKVMILGQDEMYVGDTALFPATITPNSAYKGLFWSTSDPSIATVDGLGNVTALMSGSVTITAVSALDDAVTHEYPVEVFEKGTDSEIGLRALDYIKANMPEFAAADFDLPVYPNNKVMVTWTKADATTITDGVFATGTITADSQTALTCKVEYDTFSVEEVLSLKLVVDLEDNGFKANQLVKDYLDAYFYNFTKTTPDKLDHDVVLPTTLKATTISWATSNAAILSKTGLYVRPNDDQIVTLSATVTTAGVGMPLEYKVFVKGYTIEEKVAFILEEGDLVAYKDLAAQSNIVLPTRDSKFNLLMAWVSSDVTVLDNTGAYVNRDLAADTDITYTVTFTDDRYTPNETGTGTVAVKALKATDTSKAVYDFTHDATLMATIPSYFPYGLKNRAGGNTITGLPNTVTGHDGVTIEWAGNPEDFDGVSLKTQYLRYHESLLTATFKKTDVASTEISFVVNTGLAKEVDTMYIGGRFSEQTTTVATDKYDLLNTFSFFDKAVGKTVYTGQQYWSAFSGYTFYIDGDVDVLPTPTTFTPNAEGQRFQYFAMDFVTVYITAVDDAGVITGYEFANLREKTGGNWGILFVNLTDKVAKAALATYASGNGTDGEPWISQGSREGALTFDGFRKGFVADATGKVVLGSGFGVIQSALPSTARTVDIPANGYGMTFKTQENQPIVGLFCQPDTTLTFESYNLASQNDFRYMYYMSNVNAAKTKLDAYHAAKADVAVETAAVFPSGTGEKTAEEIAAAIEAYYTGLVNGVDANLKAAENYSLYDHAALTPLTEITFGTAAFGAEAARSALLWDVKVAALKADLAAEDYLTKLQALYTPYSALAQGVKDLIVDHVWLETEYTTKLDSYDISLVLNDGSIYMTEKADVNEQFLADLYKHLQDSGFNAWISKAADGIADVTHTLPSFEEFINPASTHPDSFIKLMMGPKGDFDLFNAIPDHFARVWLFEFWSVNHDAFTVDVTGTDKHFFRQAKYNKWVDMLWMVNEMAQAGNQTGRDVMGRNGELYRIFYFPDGTVWGSNPVKHWSEVVSTGPVATNRAVGKYFVGLVPDGCSYTDQTIKDKYVHSAAESQTLVDSMTIQYTGGDTVVSVPAALKVGFEVEWYLDAAFTQKATLTPEGLGKADVTLYAKWNPVDPAQYTVTFDGTTIPNQMVNEFGKVVRPAAPTKTGEVFENWYLDAAFTKLYDFNWIVASDFTLYPKFELPENVWEITLVTNNTQTLDNIVVDRLGELAPEPTGLVKAGHILEGWYTDAAFTTKFDFAVAPTSNLTLYAKWDAAWMVSFVPNNETVLDDALVYVGDLLPEPVVTKEGYTLDGWYTEAAFTNKFNFAVAPASDVTLYAKWVINQYTLTFVDSAGSVIAPITSDFGTALTMPGNPTKDYYTFDAWYSDEALTMKFTGTTMPASNLTLRAKYIPIEYTVTYSSTNLALYGVTKAVLVEAFLHDFYDYLGLATAATPVSYSDFAHGVGKTTGYAGLWTTYKAKLYAANSKEVDDTKLIFINSSTYNAKWVPFFDHIDVLAKEVNSTQGFWYSTWTGNLRLNAWIQDAATPYTVEQLGRLPMLATTAKFTVETAVTLPTLIRLDATQVFGGWYNNAEFTGEAVASLPVGSHGDITLYAKITPAS